MKRVALVTLGCAKNEVDSEHIKGSLAKHGYALVEDFDDAEAIIVNTCGFIEAAKQESIDAILEAGEHKRGADCRLIVTGCLAQRYGEELLNELTEVDAVLGLDEEWRLGKILDSLDGQRICLTSGTVRTFTQAPARMTTGRPSAYLQIADGCNNACSFCAIPSIRGGFRSKPLEMIEEEANRLVERGAREINLIAQDTGRYGVDLYGKRRLPELLDRLAAIRDLARLRLLYLQPSEVSRDLLAAVERNDKVCHYLDIPLQHSSKNVLRRMRRAGDAAAYRSLISSIRAQLPDIALRTTVIVGFPGETERDFLSLSRFVQENRFDYLGIFEYSQEEGTVAAQLSSQIDSSVKRERREALEALQSEIDFEKQNQWVGNRVDVLVEREIQGLNAGSLGEGFSLEGRTRWQAPDVDGLVLLRGKARVGQIVPVVIEGLDGADFIGRIQNGTC